MTLPSSGPLKLGGETGATNSVNNEFGYGNDMASYQGVFYGLGGQVYQFPTVNNQFPMSSFYSTEKIAGGSQSFTSSQAFTIPTYNTMSITCVGGSGGASGQFGFISSPCPGAGSATPSDNGTSGGASSFGGYAAASGGAGGSGNNVAGQSGQSVTITLTNPVHGGSGPPSGSSISITVGGGGAGGQGGCNIYQLIVGSTNFGCSCWGRFATGATGTAGSVQVTWS